MSAPESTSDLLAGSLPRPGPSTDHFDWQVPDGWQQGRGAFGGLVLAALVRAIEASEPDKDRLVRAVNAEIAGPVLPGLADIHVVQNRRGNSLSSWNATLHQGEQGIVRCSAVLARTRSQDAPSIHLPVPTPGNWDDVPPMPLINAPGVPVFTRHLEFRALGAAPFSGADQPVVLGWVRARHPLPSLGAAEIVAFADAYWPSCLVTFTAPRPMGTVSFSLQIFPPDPPLDPATPLFYRGRVLAQQHGFMAELRELWTPDGRIVALNQQTIAWIR